MIKPNYYKEFFLNEMSNDLPKKLLKLKDLQKFPDDQLYTCTNKEVSTRHKLNVPYKCGCRHWIGGGVVKIQFYSNNPKYGTQYQSSDYVSIKELTPIENKTWKFDDINW